MHPLDRALAALGAVAGLLGVGLAAAAAHVTGPGSVATAAEFLLFHAPALMVLAVLAATGLAHPRLVRVAGLGLAAGLVLFSGDLALRGLHGLSVWRLAAPTGGVILMLGWALAGLACAVGSGTRPARTPT